MTYSPKDLEGALYPARLRELAKPPRSVYLVGELPRGRAVAIVGTREPTREAADFARGLGRELAQIGVAVFSGGAAGIDTAAHVGALEGEGVTVVVAPSSFDRPYPQTNEALFRRIVDSGGAFVTPYPLGTVAAQHHFFERNAILAAMVDVLVIVETRVRGGARNAAKVARTLGRPVLVVPGAPWNPAAAGCLLEIRRGAGLATSLNDVLVALDLPETRVERPKPLRPNSQLSFEVPDFMEDRETRAVLKCLEKGPVDPDTIGRETGVSAARVQALLLTLTLDLIVVSDPSGRVSLARY